jgi:hypothetical protein
MNIYVYHGLRAKTRFYPTMKTDYDETIGTINVIHRPGFGKSDFESDY